jgi:glycosyltransferase involved in cell wall biosynthesis
VKHHCVAFLVNGAPGSAMAQRAKAFADRLRDRFDCPLIFRAGTKVGAVGRFLRALAELRPSKCYVFDLAASGVAAAGIYRHLSGAPFVVDTGDAVVELGLALGRGPAGVAATRAMEAYALRAASSIVVRGRFHRDLLARSGVHAAFIPDGVSVDQFTPKHTPPQDAHRPLVIGLVGSSVWSPARQSCYGWDLVELVRRLKSRLPRPVHGIMIGDGDGIGVLQQRCRNFGIEDAIQFAGRVPYDELPRWLQRFDICLSTQTNDLIGKVRTTGKLPLYLAAGRFVLASQVGEAARILPPEMLIPFAGDSDPDYPEKQASRIEELVARGTDLSHRPECVALAREHFDYDQLAPRVAAVLASV